MAHFLDVLKSKKAWKRLFSSSGWKAASKGYRALAAIFLLAGLVGIILAMAIDTWNAVEKIIVVLVSIIASILGALFSINANQTV